jgi:predicted DNA-binding transcriptional regulator YafY
MDHGYDKKLFRLVKMLNLLQEKGKITTLELAEEFNISRRTAQRDISRLSAAGFPVTESEEEKGTYSFFEGYSLRKLPLSDKEASLLVFTCDIARQLGGGFEDAYKNIFAKLLSGGDWNSPFYLMSAKPSAAKNVRPFFTQAQTAIERHCQIRLTYNPAGGKQKSYTLEPLKLVFNEGHWYLVSRVAGLEWIVKNRLDRIEKLETLSKTFVPPKNMDKILRDSSSIWFTEKRDIKVRLRVSAEIAESTISRARFPLQKIIKRHKDGSVILETTLCHYLEAIPTIYRCIPYIKVLSPKDLAQSVKRDISSYLKNL